MQRQYNERLILERKFLKDFRKLVTKYEEEVLKTYTHLSQKGVPTHNISVMVGIPNYEFKEQYQKLLYKHLLRVEKNARNQTDELIQLQRKKQLGQEQKTISFKELPITWLSLKAKNVQTTLDGVFSKGIPIPNKPYKVQQNKAVKEYLEDYSLRVSKSTADRINRDIQEILTKSETEGINSRGVAEYITNKFKDLKTWEAERIARTEINAANNLITHQRLLDSDLVDYKQWITAQDHRVRGLKKGDKANHVKMNGEIARMGDAFSNGLQYPGDHNGPVAEFINCRCTLVPYIPDYDMIAPSNMTHFHEEDMQRLPTNTGQQITLQFNETQKLYDVMDGYMKLNLSGITSLTPKKPSLITRLLGNNRKPKININNPLKAKPNEGKRFQGLLSKLDDNDVTVHIGKNLEKPVFVQNGKEILKPAGINGTEIEEFEKLYSNILGNVLSSKEQKALDKLMNRLKKNGGYVRVSQDGRVQVNWRGKFTSKERNLLRDLQQKRIDVLMKNNLKPTWSTPVIPPKVKPKEKPKAKSAKPKPKEKLKPKITKLKTKSTQNPQTKLIGTHTKPPLNPSEVKKMSFEDLADYYEVEYKGLIKSDYDGKKYHTFVEHLPDSSTMEIKFEEAAVKSYTKAGIATPQEIIQEVLRIPKQHKIDTDRIWFKNTNQGIMKRPTKSGFDSLGADVGGYNTYYGVEKKGRRIIGGVVDAPHHEIVINPKYFKGAKGKYAEMWKTKEGHIENWKHAIRHEFTHSIDTSRQRFEDGVKRACYEQEYMDIEHDEKYFTSYANSAIHESYAEHGGYVSYMLDHPEDHAKTITISIIEDNKYVRKDINFEEYKEMFPKHYEYFRKLCLGG